MRIDVLTLFPDMVDAPLSMSIVGRARKSGLLDLHLHDIRTWTDDVHRSVDDTPFGGGAGMVMKSDPICRGVDAIRAQISAAVPVVILSAAGKLFTQARARQFAERSHMILVCGHYEGIDDRVRQLTGAEELSVGDYVLTGGELPAAIVIDAVTRLIPGAIRGDSIVSESHDPDTGGLLEYPQFTRPATYRGLAVPDVLLSGNHAEIARWRRAESVRRTAANRPDVLARAELSEAERAACNEQTELPDDN